MSQPFKILEEATTVERETFLKIPIVKELTSEKQSLDKDRLFHIYVQFLKESYFHVKAASSCYALAGSRVDSEHEEIKKYLFLHSYEEQGHHNWILDDLKALGADPLKIKKSRPSKEALSLVSFMYYVAAQENPIAILADTFVIEGLSQFVGAAASQSLKSSNFPKEAMTYLITHSELDQGHMDHFKNMFNSAITKFENSPLEEIIYYARMEYKLYGDVIQALENCEDFRKLISI
jgi:pyrroloquinoline quinone (PQQ) biosynthesis protein C